MRLVQETRREDPELSLNGRSCGSGSVRGVNADTLRGWMKQAVIDAGERAGTTSSNAAILWDIDRGRSGGGESYSFKGASSQLRRAYLVQLAHHQSHRP